MLRNALEAAGLTVGEAANDLEGERTTKRIQPDAILADLMIDAEETIAHKFKQSGITIPLYMVSTAADALVGAVGLHELGISGIFLKPVDTSVITQTLKTRLGAG